MKRQSFCSKKEKVISTIISVGIIMALVFGIYSVTQTVKKDNKQNNIVNLNETKEDVALKTRDTEDEDAGQNVEEANGTAVDNNKETLSETIEETQKETQKETQNQTISVEEAAAAILNEYPFSEQYVLGWPVKGNVGIKYSMDSTVFFKTLGQYKCSPAMYLNADVDSEVRAAASGIVKTVAQKKETGLTMTISMGNGYEAVYGMLNNVSLRANDTVNKGDLLGTVGMQSAYYKEEGPGVYFQILKNNEPVDPMSFLEQVDE